jgi:hypothetical protein
LFLESQMAGGTTADEIREHMASFQRGIVDTRLRMGSELDASQMTFPPGPGTLVMGGKAHCCIPYTRIYVAGCILGYPCGYRTWGYDHLLKSKYITVIDWDEDFFIYLPIVSR